MLTPRTVSEALCEATGADAVQCIGSKFVLYRQSSDEDEAQDRSGKMRTGILGGTFNPPHLGHLHAAELAHRALNLDRVLFIPTNIPPHKVLPENTASAEDRCEMVRRLTAEKRGRYLTL